MTKTIERRPSAPGLRPLPEIDDATRREFLIGAGSLLLLGAAGCGGGEGAGRDEATSGGTRAIEHKYGTTEIEGRPERVVTVGYSDYEAVLALGVTPIGVRAFIEDQVTWPWNEEELGDAEPEILPAEELNFEQIANLRPDLILAVYSGLTDEEYETLSEIAPTVAQSGEYVDYGTPWQAMTRVIGHALGQKERAEEIVTEIEDRIDDAREKHPEFEGSTLVLASLDAGGTYYLYGPQDSRIQVLNSLGFELPPEVAELADDAFFAEVSRERLNLADADVLVWQVDAEDQREAIEDDPLYQKLDVYGEGRDLFLVGFEPLRIALGLSTVLSLPFLLDRLVPMLAAAVDGNPETEVTS